MWNIARWLAFFTASYLVYHQSGSTLLAQLVGTAFFAPMFIGGLLGGLIADRFDKRRVLIAQFWFLVALSLALSADVIGGYARPWHVYVAILLLGSGAVFDVTCRRALIAEVSGAAFLRSAFAMEAMSNTGGALLGNLVGGITIYLAGPGESFTIVGILCAIGAIAQASVRVRVRPVATVRAAVRQELVAGVRYSIQSPALLGVLFVTMVMNTFFFTYTPWIPVFAQRLGVTAFWAGVLGSAAGLGSFISAFVIAGRFVPISGVKLYVGGAALSLVSVTAFAFSGLYPLALFALVAAGLGSSGFSTMQSALVVATTPAMLRGRMMGIVSMAIGVLPFAMLALGVVSEFTGPIIALRASGILGVAVLGVVYLVSRSMRGLDSRHA